ncbi:PLP-dependent aminotransferase family protein [Coralliovum pocilloporae]|uniref:MocR-like pyridoxine biosynthesis transcription factor PdxR n=1 Tax=Coralliovum pocilloporae TaxID=3066369 RepID=UPI003306B85C
MFTSYGTNEVMEQAVSSLALDRALPEPLNRQLYRQIKAAIVSGTMPAHLRLPATRQLADMLDVGRNTVVAAYEQLTMEGYLITRKGGGTRVAPAADQFLPGDVGLETVDMSGQDNAVRLSRAGEALTRVQRRDEEQVLPMQPCMPDPRLFPSDLWARCLRRAGRQITGRRGGYEYYQGLPRLKSAIMRHLVEFRGLRAGDDQLLVLSSAQAALDLVARMLVDPGDEAWIEEPGYHGMRASLFGVGARIVPVPVDEEGVSIKRQAGDPRLIYVTPSHQYPTGVFMGLERRTELLNRAAQTGAFIIEDDYDSEFHYRGRPIASLQGLDQNGSVIYMGTFAKTMLPALRVAYLVVPRGLVEAFSRALRNTGQVPSLYIQDALADFIEDGHYRAHVRQMRQIYEQRRDVMAKLLLDTCGAYLNIVVPDGGMQLVAWLRDQTMDDVSLAMQFRALGFDGVPLSPSYTTAPRRQGLLLGFASSPEQEIQRASRALLKLLQERASTEYAAIG